MWWLSFWSSDSNLLGSIQLQIVFECSMGILGRCQWFCTCVGFCNVQFASVFWLTFFWGAGNKKLMQIQTIESNAVPNHWHLLKILIGWNLKLVSIQLPNCDNKLYTCFLKVCLISIGSCKTQKWTLKMFGYVKLLMEYLHSVDLLHCAPKLWSC